MFYLSPVHFKTVAHNDESVSRTCHLYAVRRSARPSIQLETRELRGTLNALFHCICFATRSYQCMKTFLNGEFLSTVVRQ